MEVLKLEQKSPFSEVLTTEKKKILAYKQTKIFSSI